MRLVKWEPIHEISNLHNQIDKLFGDFWKDPKTSFNWNTPIDVVETKEAYKVKADLPGLNKENIDISIENNVLTLKAERKEEKEEKEHNYYHKEISYGTFQRQVAFANNVDGDSVNAKYADGVLEILVPKVEKEKTKKISIQ